MTTDSQWSRRNVKNKHTRSKEENTKRLARLPYVNIFTSYLLHPTPPTMIKKIFRFILKSILAIIILGLLSYALFHLGEYTTGGKYVKYLTDHSETVKLEENFSYDIASQDLEKSKVILVGESHGFDEPNKFDVDFFIHLHKNFGVKTYFAELDYVQGLFMNAFLKSGDEALLRDILKNWVVAQGRNNQDYFDKYKALQKFYSELPEDEKFQFIGIDKIQDQGLMLSYLNTLARQQATPMDKTTPVEEQINQVLYVLKERHASSPDTLSILDHISKNIAYQKEMADRATVMFQNFEHLYKLHKLANQRVYGYFGLFHVFQYRVNGDHPLGSHLRKSGMFSDGELLSFNFLMNDSYMVMPSRKLPEFMRDEGKYSRMPISADNLLFMYMYGIKDFKRMTPEHHKSFIRMNGDDNPYSTSSRMRITIQLLPVTDLFEMTDKGKPYVQYTIFVRNSDWAEPMTK